LKDCIIATIVRVGAKSITQTGNSQLRALRTVEIRDSSNLVVESVASMTPQQGQAVSQQSAVFRLKHKYG
jgi:hypothetical protein